MFKIILFYRRYFISYNLYIYSSNFEVYKLNLKKISKKIYNTKNDIFYNSFRNLFLL